MRPKNTKMATALTTMAKVLLPMNTLTMLVITTAIRPTIKKLPHDSRLRLVKYPHMLMVANKMAAPMNAVTILAVVNVMNMVLMLRPIKAAKICSMPRA